MLARRIALGALLAGGALFVPPAAILAQTPGVREMVIARGAAGVDTFRVHVRFAGGLLRLMPAAEPVLYDARIRYDAERARPVARFDTVRNRLEVGVETGPLSRGLRIGRQERDDDQPSELHLQLGRGTPTELTVETTGSRAELDLGGVPLHLLRLRATATESTTRFTSINPSRISRLELTARAASLHVEGTQLARADRVVTSVLAGQVVLDLSSEWQGDLVLEVSATMGQVELRVPEDIGVRVTARERLGGRISGMGEGTAGEYRSGNWDRAPHRLDVIATVMLGNVTVHRTR